MEWNEKIEGKLFLLMAHQEVDWEGDLSKWTQPPYSEIWRISQQRLYNYILSNKKEGKSDMEFSDTYKNRAQNSCLQVYDITTKQVTVLTNIPHVIEAPM